MSASVHRQAGAGKYSNEIAGYLFVGPWLFGFLTLTILPLAASLYLSFTNYDMFTAPKCVDSPISSNVLRRRPLLAFRRSHPVLCGHRGPPAPDRGPGRGDAPQHEPSGHRPLPRPLLRPLGGGRQRRVAVMWRQIFGGEGLLNSVLRLAGLPGKPSG
jgi:multiple sugar transport system permease protein